MYINFSLKVSTPPIQATGIIIAPYVSRCLSSELLKTLIISGPSNIPRYGEGQELLFPSEKWADNPRGVKAATKTGSSDSKPRALSPEVVFTDFFGGIALVTCRSFQARD